MQTVNPQFEDLSKQELIEHLQKAHSEIIYLRAMFELFQRKKFSSSSERFEGQTLLFNEAEASASDKTPLTKSKIETHERHRGKRKPLPEILPRVEVIHDLSESQRKCECGCELKEFSQVVSEQLDIVPAKVQVIRHCRKKYACPSCQVVKIAKVPPQPLPKTNASAGMLAYVATAKYVDALPLHRQEEIFRRLGIHMPRSTLSRWMIDLATILKPLYQSLEDELLASDVIHMDETTVQVMKGSGKPASAKNYMWLRCRGGPKPIILFSYSPSRSAEIARKLLSGFSGSLLTDGYEAYRSVVATRGDLTHYGCWDHARRPFFEAAKGRHNDDLAKVGLSYIQELYAVERQLEKAHPEAIERARNLYSRSIIRHLRLWVDRVKPTVLPKSLLGKALSYLDSQWDRLVRYLDNGHVPISNCRAENAIRPFVIGRKNWLFSQTSAGAEASAIIYSIIETAKANGHEPYAYLRDVIAMIPRVQSVSDLEALLP